MATQHRNMDLFRRILMEVREHPPGRHEHVELEVEGFTPDEVSYHVGLLYQAGLIDAYKLEAMGKGIQWFPREVTFEGHEFLDATEDSSVWSAVRAKAQEVGGVVPLEVLKSLAIGYLKDRLGPS